MTNYQRSYFADRKLTIVVTIASVVYVMVMMKLLFFRSTPPRESYMYNLIPFATIKQYISLSNHFPVLLRVINLLGNIILFIPIGILLPLLNKRLLHFTPFLVVTVTILIMVEVIQLVTRVGSLDVDDIILNTVGAWIGILGTRAVVNHLEKGSQYSGNSG